MALSLALPVGTGCVSAASEDDLGSADDELRSLTDAEIVGTLAPGETKTVEVAPKPFYRAFALTVAAGERLELTVRSEDGAGDPQAWLLGSSFQTLARSTDVSSTDASARFERTISKAGTYYLAIRDEGSRTMKFTVSRGGASAPQPARCTSDAQCGGGSAMCFIDRCATVSESSFPVNSSFGGGPAAAYTLGGELRVAYQTWRHNGSPGRKFELFEGPIGRARGDGGRESSRQFFFDGGPGFEPVLSTWVDGGESALYGGWTGLSLAKDARVKQVAVGRNGAGTLFMAVTEETTAPVYTSDPAYRNTSPTCSLWFASRQGGTWTAPVLVDDCGWDPHRNLAIHVRKDGTADVVAADGRGIFRYHRSNPIDPWAKTPLVVGQGQAAFASAHGLDGTTHLVTQPFNFTGDGSGARYTGTYVELGDEGTVRTIPLSKHEQSAPPFRDLQEDGEGNVWALKATGTRSVVRIDRAGSIAERSLGDWPTGGYRSSALAVSRAGEVSIVYGGDGLFVRRFTPVK